MKKLILLIISFLLIGSLFAVAEEEVLIEPVPFNLIDWLISLFGTSRTTTTNTCSDGTLVDSCSKDKPKECIKVYSSVLQDYKIFFVNSCVKCGCPSGKECDTNTDECVGEVVENACSYNGIYYKTTICSISGGGIYECRYPSNFYVKSCSCTPLEVNPVCTTPTCTSHYSYKCYSGDVYWYNSCNVKEGIKTDCSSTQTCSDGKCVSSSVTCTSGQTGACTATNGCAGTKTCVSNAWGNCVTNLQKCSDGTCKANCGGTTPSDADAPTIYSIEMVESPDKLLTKRPGNTIPLKIELRFPNGWKLSEADAIDKELKIEIGVYDYDYALSAGWIKDVPWYSRLWAVGKEAVPCVEKEAEFVNTYTFQHMASIVAIFDKCNPESDFYILEKDSCILPLEIKNIGGDLYATLPLSTSKFSDGKSNYNKEGHYVIHIGLYYDCGEYIQGDKSRYQYEMIVSRSAQDTDCTKDFTYPCPNGKVIILYYCNATTNKLGPYTYVTCDGGDGNGGDEHNKATQISLTKKQWDTASKEMVLKSTCAWYDQCIQMEGYDVACYSDDEVRSKIKNAQSAALDIANLIKTLTGLGEIKDGTCRATPVSDFDYCKFTEPLAFFSITNNKCQDGMIIIIGGIFLLLLLPKLLGDKK